MYLFLLTALVGCPKTAPVENTSEAAAVAEYSEDDPVGTEEAFGAIMIRSAPMPLDFEDVLGVEDLRELYGDPGEMSPDEWFKRLSPMGQEVYLTMLMTARQCDDLKGDLCDACYCMRWVQPRRGALMDLMQHAPHLDPDLWSHMAERTSGKFGFTLNGKHYDSLEESDHALMIAIIRAMHPSYEPSRYNGEPLGEW